MSLPNDGRMVDGRTGIIHRFCAGCYDEHVENGIARDFDCFDDGCGYECCGCGACVAPEKCEATGKGYVWHR